MSNINKAAVLNPFSDLTANILDYVPRATTSEFGIVAIGSGINVDALGRIYLDTQEYSDRLTAIEAQAASSLATQQTEVAAAIAQVNLTQSQAITALTLEVNNLKTDLTDSITATQTELINRADQLAQDVTDITEQLTQDKATFTQDIQDALDYLEDEASVASALRTPRKINGTDFDGSSDITTDAWGATRTFQIGNKTTSINGASNVAYSLADIGAFPQVGGTIQGDVEVTGNLSVAGTISATLEGTAASADKISVARKIQGVDFDGTQDISLPTFSTQIDGLVPKRVGSTTTKYLREDGTWVVPTDTTYALLTKIAAEDGTATAANTISAQVLKEAIQYHAPTVTNIVGNAETATKLQTPRTINGISFDGTQDISLPEPAAYSLPTASDSVLGGIKVGSGLAISNSVLSVGTLNQSTTGNAATATKLQTPRTIALTGKVTGSVSFDGSANASITTAITGLGVANGIATLDSNGQVPSTQLPSFVDDVLEYENVAAFPATGESGKIYVETTGNTTYRWSGTAYVKITSGEVASVAGKTGIVTLSKADVGLANADNTADIDKPISIDTQQALDTKVNTSDVITIEKGGTGATTVEQAKINLGLAAIRLPAGTNLNNVITPGTYYCDLNAVAATMLNIPTDMAFSLKVDATAGVIQEFTSYAQAGTRKFIRGFYVSWSPWQEVVKGANAAESRANLGLGSAALYNVGVEAGGVLTVGAAFGLGWVGERINIASSFELVNTIFNKSQFIGINQPGSSVIEAYSSGIFSQCQDTFMYLAAGPSGKLVLISGVMGASGSITETIVKTNKNTWVDGNGFIKAASPIVKLYAEKIKLNDEAKLQNILFEKLGAGDYLIKGSSGFAQDGWYIEQPKDSNGNIYHAVEYGTHGNGDIWIKTYEQTMDGTRIVADPTKPIDIKEARFISIRLNELPKDDVAPQNPTIVDNEGNSAPSRLHELVDGVWVISEENAAILEQERLAAMKPLKRRQFRLALAMNGYDLKEIETLINQIEDPMQRTIAQIEWQDATDFERTNPTLLMMAELLQLTSEQVDQLWNYGLTL